VPHDQVPAPAGPPPRSARLRLLPAPRWEPPFDVDPVATVVASRRPSGPRQDALALTFVLSSGLPATPLPPRLRLVDTSDAHPIPPIWSDDETTFGRQHTGTAELPDARAWCARLAQAIVEVTAGARPVSQLRRWTSDCVYADLRRRVPTPARHEPARRLAHPSGPPSRSPTLRSMRVCEPADGVVEASLVVDRGRRAIALALRLEGADGRWRCTVLSGLSGLAR
jgi:hypothetical protein